MCDYFLLFSLTKLDNLSSSVPKATNTNVTNRKKVTKKPSRNGQQPNLNSSYEHHLEKWLENASKMNFDYNNFDGNWPIMNSSSGATNRKGNHLQYSSADPISLPPHIVSSVFLMNNLWHFT